MNRTVIYARVSPSKSDTSVPNQVRACAAFIERLPDSRVTAGWNTPAEWGLPGVRAYWDEQRTGTNENRAGWQAVLELCEARAIDRVIVDKRDRVWRNADDFRRFRDKFMRSYGVQIVPVMGLQVEPGNIWTEWAEEDEFIQAERFSQRLSRITSAGRLRRLEAGYWPTFAPFGCMKGDVKGVPVANPETWPALLHIFSMWSKGATDARVRRWLFDNQIPAPRGGGWSSATVARIRGNEFYIGEFWQGGNVYHLKHECRIDRALWDAAQGELPIDRGGRPNNGEYIYLLSRVVCSHYAVTAPRARAGEPLPLYGRSSRGKAGTRYEWYRRADTLRSTGGMAAVRVNDGEPDELRAHVDARMLDRAVVELLITMADDRDWLLLQVGEAQEEQAMKLSHRLTTLRRQRAVYGRDLLKLENNIVRLVGDGQYGDVLAVVNARLAELRAKIAEHDASIAALDAELKDTLASRPDVYTASERLNGIRLLWESGAYKELRALLAVIIDRVDVRLDKPKIYFTPLMTGVSHTATLVARMDKYGYHLALRRERLVA